MNTLMIIIYISNVYHKLLLFIFIALFIFNLINIEMFDTNKLYLLFINNIIILLIILYLRINLEIINYDN